MIAFSKQARLAGKQYGRAPNLTRERARVPGDRVNDLLA